MSILQIRHNEAKLFESEKCVDKECVVASREVSSLPKNFVQYWVDTGHLPFQFYKDTAVHSDIGSSLSEEGSSYKDYAICNTMLKHKLNGQQLCDNGSSNSSVDTAAYVLSNTNVAKKENIYPRFFRKDRVLKIHKDINYENNNIDTTANIYENNINKNCAFDIYSSNKANKRDKELEEENIEEIELKLSSSCKEDDNTICENDNQVNEDDDNNHNEELVKNSAQKTDNVTNANRNNSFSEDLNTTSVRQLRQKKLYAGRESPIDINMSIISESMDDNIYEKRRNLHPAYRYSPLLQKPYRKFMPKKRKYKFFFENCRNKSLEATSSNNSTSDSIDVETRRAKRQKCVDDPIDQFDETPFLLSSISQVSGADKLRQSCREMEKQIKRFATSEFINTNELKQLKPNLRKGHKLKSKTKTQGKEAQEETNARTVSSNTLNEKREPIVLLERLSEELIERYTVRKDLRSKETKKERISIKNMENGRNKRNSRKRPIISENAKPCSQVENIVDSGNSNASTMIIYSHLNSPSTNCCDSNDAATMSNSMPLSNSHNAEKNKLGKFPNDVKLTQFRPVVVLERLHTTESSKKEGSKKERLSGINNLKNKLQPVVVLERLVDIYKNSIHNINSLSCNGSHETDVTTVESRKTNNQMDDSYGHRKKVLYFKTCMYSDSDSDSDSDVSSPDKSFNSLKCNIPEYFKSTKDKNTSFSKMHSIKQKLGNKCIVNMSAYNKNSFPGEVSCTDRVDNQLHNSNRSSNNQKVVLSTTQLASANSEKNKGILENGVINAVNIDANTKSKRNTLVFVTKAYDSDSD